MNVRIARCSYSTLPVFHVPLSSPNVAAPEQAHATKTLRIIRNSHYEIDKPVRKPARRDGQLSS